MGNGKGWNRIMSGKKVEGRGMQGGEVKWTVEGMKVEEWKEGRIRTEQ